MICDNCLVISMCESSCEELENSCGGEFLSPNLFKKFTRNGIKITINSKTGKIEKIERRGKNKWERR
ncbi:MAG: hypothetical protein ACFFG0_02070 [Candidatus Thorarchaeota archaeon]